MAVCGLLREIANLEDDRLCGVARDACEACCRELPPSRTRLNPVVASLLLGVIERAEWVAGRSSDDIDELRSWAMRSLRVVEIPVPNSRGAGRGSPEDFQADGVTRNCDVVIACDDSGPETERAVRSVLEQRSAAVVLHLTDDGGGGAPLLERFGGLPDVVTHRNTTPKGLFGTLHDLLPHVRSDYVALQTSTSISLVSRICYSVGTLEATGADIAAAPLRLPGGEVAPPPPGKGYGRWIPPETLVFRRSSLVDMGGVAARQGDEDAELIHRASREGRRFVYLDHATVEATASPIPGPLGPEPVYTERWGSLRHHAKGFPEEHVACDVVLSFDDESANLDEALRSVLEQDRAEAIVHLVDDATSRGTEVLRKWSSHPRVRTYRNERPLGSRLSFNAVVPFLETDLVAAQDSRHRSLPHRFNASGNILRVAAGDITGGRCALLPSGARFTCLGPTAMFRLTAFRQLGGFADLGPGAGSLPEVDVELRLRARHCGTRVIESRQVLLEYRGGMANGTTGPAEAAREEIRKRIAAFRQGAVEARALGALANGSRATSRWSAG